MCYPACYAVQQGGALRDTHPHEVRRVAREGLPRSCLHHPAAVLRVPCAAFKPVQRRLLLLVQLPQDLPQRGKKAKGRECKYCMSGMSNHTSDVKQSTDYRSLTADPIIAVMIWCARAVTNRDHQAKYERNSNSFIQIPPGCQ